MLLRRLFVLSGLIYTDQAGYEFEAHYSASGADGGYESPVKN